MGLPEPSKSQHGGVSSLGYVFAFVNGANILVFSVLPLIHWLPSTIAQSIINLRPYSYSLVLFIDVLVGIGYLTADAMQGTGQRGWVRQLAYILERTVLFLFLPAALLSGALVAAAYLLHWGT